MKFPIPLSFLLFAFIGIGFGREASSVTQPTRHIVEGVSSVEIYFSPKGGIERAIINEITNAQNSIQVLAYSFTSAPIAQALGRARDRGVDVQVILDKSHRTNRYSVINYLQSHRIPVFIDRAHAIAHNKVMIFDNQHVITGSYNFTGAAETRNSENLLFIRNEPRVARIYVAEWNKLRTKSESAPYTGAPIIVEENSN